jgi:HD-GYP domain-containing protein (c-di-GMP phosphodiesterase class II)
MVRRSIWPLDLIKRIGQRDGDDAAGPFSMLAPDSNQSALDGLDSYVGHKAYAEQLRASLPAEEEPPMPRVVARPRPPTQANRLIESWGALGGRLSVVLHKGTLRRDCLSGVLAAEAELVSLLERAPDAALYLMFQLSQSRHSGYSTSHALLCACLSQLLGKDLELEASDLSSLTRAALTMNVAVTALQDELARQPTPITTEQQRQVTAHSVVSRLMLEKAGVRDTLWLDVVESHHARSPDAIYGDDQPRCSRLIQLLGTIDRYSACLAARESRPSRSAEVSAQAALESCESLNSVQSHLFHTIGLYPPGTYVRLQSLEAAVVVRRGDAPHSPIVARVQSADGFTLQEPTLCDTSLPGNAIIESLAACDVEIRLNHESLLLLAGTVPEPQEDLPGAMPAARAPRALAH